MAQILPGVDAVALTTVLRARGWRRDRRSNGNPILQEAFNYGR